LQKTFSIGEGEKGETYPCEKEKKDVHAGRIFTLNATLYHVVSPEKNKGETIKGNRTNIEGDSKEVGEE